ncbi:hypothetical protein L9F63_028224 [Diploptera punctata]|uniref:Uncharacterized protein n=1 Tax=Diploptera punctata TaxID=6984 RepID=A0AAD7ZVN7_DIPPU|nr:hypothetical protein L9F63_028224 [Diploptera punctata]
MIIVQYYFVYYKRCNVKLMSSEGNDESTSSGCTRKIANVMKIYLQKGKNTNYNCEKFNLSVEELLRSTLPIESAINKLQDLNALLPYVPFPWRNYFKKVLNPGDASRPPDDGNVDVFSEEEQD